MSAKDKKALQETAKQFVHQLAKTVAENDPEKERAFRESEAQRDAEVVKKLRALRAKRKK